MHAAGLQPDKRPGKLFLASKPGILQFETHGQSDRHGSPRTGLHMPICQFVMGQGIQTWNRGSLKQGIHRPMWELLMRLPVSQPDHAESFNAPSLTFIGKPQYDYRAITLRTPQPSANADPLAMPIEPTSNFKLIRADHSLQPAPGLNLQSTLLPSNILGRSFFQVITSPSEVPGRLSHSESLASQLLPSDQGASRLHPILNDYLRLIRGDHQLP